MTQEPIEQPMTIQLSQDWLKLLSMALAALGFLSLLPLASAQYIHATNICPFNSGMDCELVVRSVYSRIGPLPVSYLGLMGFLMILVALLFETHLPSAKVIIFGLTLFGCFFSGYLLVVQALVLRVWCQVCTQISLVMIALFATSLIRLWKAISRPIEDDNLLDETA